MIEKTNQNAMQRAILTAGGLALFADAFGISVQAVHKWSKRGTPPADRCIEIERLTNGEVTRYDLRPDIFGDKAA